MGRTAGDGQDTAMVTVEAVRDRVAGDTVPLPATCAVCGRPTGETAWFHLECDRTTVVEPPHRSGSRPWLTRLAALFVGRVGMATEQPCRQIEWLPVDVPLRIHGGCWREHPASHNEQALRMLMRIVPFYNDLLAHHPRTRIRAIEA